MVDFVSKARKNYLLDLGLPETLECFIKLGVKQPIYRKKTKTKNKGKSSAGAERAEQDIVTEKIQEVEPLSIGNEQGDSL